MAKAGRPKKGSAGLPAWFDIEKYRGAKDFKAVDWFQQLGFRHFLGELLSDDVFSMDLGDEWQSLFKTHPVITTAALEECYPIIHSFEYEGEVLVSRGIGPDYLLNFISLAIEPAHGVVATTNGDIYEAYQGLSLKRQPRYQDEKWLSVYHSPYNPKSFSLAAKQKYVCVDLSLPDSILKNSFSDYLKSQRKNPDEAIGPYFRSPDFLNWYNSGVLPYLDLNLMETATGQTFQWSAFADALNSIVDRPIGSEDTLRKTVKAHAKKLMDKRAIRILKSQTTKEQSGAKKSGKLVIR